MTGLFGNTRQFESVGGMGIGTLNTAVNDVKVMQPPDDTVSSLSFSPASLQATYLVAGSWDNNIRCWEIQENGQTLPKAQQTHVGPVLDVCWSDDGTKVFSASVDKTAKVWDLNTNQSMQIAQHDAPIKTIHWIKAPNYSCIMTGSWDKTLKFWDTKSPSPMMTIQLSEKLYAADVMYPMAVATTANRGIIIYQLENTPSEFKRTDSILKYQHRCVRIFKDRETLQPTGFAIGSIEGRVAIHYVNPRTEKDNFTFKCHRSAVTNGMQDIYAVNDISFHPTYCTLATVGSDGKFGFWDKDARTKLKLSEQYDMAITCSAINGKGNIFAFSTGYDWSKGHEYNDPSKMKPNIYLRPCDDELKVGAKK